MKMIWAVVRSSKVDEVAARLKASAWVAALFLVYVVMAMKGTSMSR